MIPRHRHGDACFLALYENKATVTDPMNHVTAFEYNAVGNKIKETDPLGIETLFEYDTRYNLVKTTRVIDPAAPESNPVTRFEYNNDDKMTRQIDPEGNAVTYEYDNEGRLLLTIDATGNEIRMEYNVTRGCSTCSGGGSHQLPRIVYPTFEKTFIFDFPFVKYTRITGKFAKATIDRFSGLRHFHCSCLKQQPSAERKWKRR